MSTPIIVNIKLLGQNTLIDSLVSPPYVPSIGDYYISSVEQDTNDEYTTYKVIERYVQKRTTVKRDLHRKPTSVIDTYEITLLCVPK